MAEETEKTVTTEPVDGFDKPNFFGITYGAGDVVAFTSLFFDNLATLVGFSGAMIYGVAGGSQFMADIVYTKMIPAAGIMLFVGNAYYSYQAIRMTKKYGVPYTAQPYGFNTSGGYPFIFGILGPVYWSNVDSLGEEAAALLAWKVCTGANFVTGLMNVGFGLLGNRILAWFPVAALLVPIANVGFTFLGIGMVDYNFALPSVGLVVFFLIFTQYFAGGRFHIGKGIFLPEALIPVLWGTVFAWVYPGYMTGIASVVDPGIWIGSAFIDGLSELGPYWGTVLPIAIVASAGDIMVLVSAQKAGNPFPIVETMVADGIGTICGAILGAPFGTVVYIGHPVHQRVGGRTGYSITNGTVYLILCLSGAFPVLLSVFPQIASGPVIFVFGILICEECTKHIKPRHHSIIFFGLFFGVLNYAFYLQAPPTANGHPGTFAMSRGYMLVSMMWCSILTFVYDRRWLKAAGFCVATAVLAALGFIHQATAIGGPSFDFINGTLDGLGEVDAQRMSPLNFMIGYLSLAAFCILYWALQKKFPKTTEPDDPEFENDNGYLLPIIEEGVDDLMETWWDPVTTKVDTESPKE